MRSLLFVLAALVAVTVFVANANAALVFRGQFGGKSMDLDGYSASTTSSMGLDMDRGERFMWGARLSKSTAEVKSAAPSRYWGQCQGPWCGGYNHVKTTYDMKIVSLEANAKHYFKRDKISYYGMGFVSMNHLKLKSKMQKLKENFISVGGGVGVDFEVAPQVALNLEGRYETGLGVSASDEYDSYKIAKNVAKSKSTSVLAGIVLSF
jgi:opacity protein-like surface antigen